MRGWQFDKEGTLPVMTVASDPRNRIPDKGEKAVQGSIGGDP